MGSIGRYVFRTTMGAFVITLVSLTVVMWFTQAIREFDLITSQRQTVFVFIGITGLLIPLLVMMIAPISLVLAVAHVLNKLSSDSEIIVMNAAGVSPWQTSPDDASKTPTPLELSTPFSTRSDAALPT